MIIQVTRTPRTLWCITRCHNRLHWFRDGKNRNFLHGCHSCDTPPELLIIFTKISLIPSWPSDDTFRSSFSSLLIHSSFRFLCCWICTRGLPESTIYFIQVHRTNTVQTSISNHFLFSTSTNWVFK